MEKKKRIPPPSDVNADRRSIVDDMGRRIGHMWPEDFEAYLKATYGDGWIATFCRYAGMSRDTIDLYRKGTLPIPKHIAQLVLMIRWYDMNTPKMKVRRKVDLATPWLD
jgi:hypothetical protein